MAKMFARVLFGFGLMALSNTAYATCPTFQSFANGDPADATKVMGNFNYLLNCAGFGAVGIGTSNGGLFSSPGTQPLFGFSDSGGRTIRFATPDYNGTSTGSLFQLEFGAGSGNTYTYLSAYQAGSSAGTLVLNPNGGKVGVGTTTPSAKLHIVDTGNGANLWIESNANNAGLLLNNTQTGGHQWELDSSGGSASYPSSLTLYDRTAAAYRLLVNSTGNVGIGTTSPQGRLDIVDTANGGNLWIESNASNAGIILNDTQTGGHQWELDASGGSATYPSSLTLYDRTALAYRLVIRSTGNVGIGTTAPGQKLDVAGTIRQSNCVTAGTLSTNTSGDIICTSDARLKNILGTYESGLQAITQITPQLFTYKPTPTDPVETFVHAGFIAQDVKRVIPQAVAMQRSGYYSLDTTAILAASVNAIKQLKAENDAKAEKIARLERQVNLLNQQASEMRSLRTRLDDLERKSSVRAAAILNASHDATR